MKIRHLFFLIAFSFITSTMQAQLNGAGYYRIKNTKTERYISVCNDQVKVDAAATDVDMGSLKTFKSLDRILSDPGSIIYIKPVSGQSNSYDFFSQGIDTYKASNGVHLTILSYDGGNTYVASGTYKGVVKNLYDTGNISEAEGEVTTMKNSSTIKWNILPVSSASDNYFGVKAETLADGEYYTTLFVSFPFTLPDGMKAYVVTDVDDVEGIVVWKEITGQIPASTPVILKCNSSKSTDNRLNLLDSSQASVGTNLLKGVYFAINDTRGGYVNYEPYTSTMRMIGRTSDGSLGFVKRSGLSMVPNNQAYLNLAASAPDQLKVMTAEEYVAYKEYVAKEIVTVTANNLTREYGEDNPQLTYLSSGATLRGVPSLSTSATISSVPGTYPIVVEKGTIENLQPTFVNGTLTITKAPLTIMVKNYEREQGQENPDFEVVYEGFKNGDGTEKLSVLPTVTCAADADAHPNTYPIVVAGAVSDYYDITYVNGTLTVIEPSGIAEVMSVNSPTNVYSSTGVLVRKNTTSLHGLPKGIYIIRGRKVIVR